jgi:hypothetical protein
MDGTIRNRLHTERIRSFLSSSLDVRREYSTDAFMISVRCKIAACHFAHREKQARSTGQLGVKPYPPHSYYSFGATPPEHNGFF